MALNFGQGNGLFPTSQAADVGFRTKTLIEGVRREEQDPIPSVAPGEIVLWELGDGKGEFAEDEDAIFGFSDTTWRGAAFTLGTTNPDGDFTLASINLKLNRVASPGTITLEVTAVDGDGKPTGSVLATGTTNGNTLTTDAGGEERLITLVAPVKLNASTQYCFYLQADEHLPAGSAGMRILGGSNNAGGHSLSSLDSGTTWSTPANSVWFQLFGGGKFLITRTTDNDLYQTALTKVP